MGLNLGANDYFPKPFDLDELKARLRALMGRQSAQAGALTDNVDPGSTQLGFLRFKKKSGAIYKINEANDLTLRERKLLQTLLRKRDLVVSNENCLKWCFQLWPRCTPK